MGASILPHWNERWQAALDSLCSRVRGIRQAVGEAGPYHCPDGKPWDTTDDGDTEVARLLGTGLRRHTGATLGFQGPYLGDKVEEGSEGLLCGCNRGRAACAARCEVSWVMSIVRWSICIWDLWLTGF